MKDKHPIDKLFNEGLGNPDIPFDEKNWEILQKKLKASKRRGTTKLLWIGGTIAASLVMAATVLFYHNDEPSLEETQPLATQQLPPLKTDDEYAGQSIAEADTGTSGVTDEHTVSSSAPQHHVRSQDQLLAGDERSGTSVKGHISPVSGTKLLVASSAEKPLGGQSAGIYPNSLYTPIAASATIGSLEQPIGPERRNRFTLVMAVAPDLSGTAPVDGRLSGNIGLLAAYDLNDRFRVRSGIWYAQKRYQADFAAYRPTGGWPAYGNRPETVTANCQLLDIPLNLEYRLKQSGNSSWFLSGGVSSYIMLSEVYDFIYPGNEQRYPQQYEIRNENRHILGVVNVGVGYQRKLNPSLGITVQPFMKVPVSNIGHGNIKLYSTGVALSVDVDLSRRIKR